MGENLNKRLEELETKLNRLDLLSSATEALRRAAHERDVLLSAITRITTLLDLNPTGYQALGVLREIDKVCMEIDLPIYHREPH
jgi:hypothetical protein